jgi:hypothetical protein
MDRSWMLIRRLARLADQAWIRGDSQTYHYLSSEIESLLRDAE